MISAFIEFPHLEEKSLFCLAVVPPIGPIRTLKNLSETVNRYSPYSRIVGAGSRE